MVRTERRLDVTRDGHPIPTVAWLADRPAPPRPLVLAGHGGGGHKTDAFVVGLRDRLLPRGIAVAAIDAVGHGDRLDRCPGDEAVINVISDPAAYTTMIADWTASLDALLESGDFDAEAVGYAGLSGGCLFGLPFVAADRRIAAAALGACGYEGAPQLGDAPSTFAPLLSQAARRYDRPALFLLQADDDYFPPDGGRALFADLASADKRLVISPGTHIEVPPPALDEAADWLAARLAQLAN